MLWSVLRFIAWCAAHRQPAVNRHPSKTDCKWAVQFITSVTFLPVIVFLFIPRWRESHKVAETCLKISSNWPTPSHCRALVGINNYSSYYYYYYCRSQWPRGLRRRSTAARLLRSWVRISQGAWMFVGCECCCCWCCCQVEVSAKSWSLVQGSPTDCAASLCVI